MSLLGCLFLACITTPVRRLYAKQRRKDHHDSLETKGGEEEDMSRYHLHICSENNFPTAAGLASSAAGYACLGRQGVGQGVGQEQRGGRDLHSQCNISIICTVCI